MGYILTVNMSVILNSIWLLLFDDDISVCSLLDLFLLEFSIFFKLINCRLRLFQDIYRTFALVNWIIWLNIYMLMYLFVGLVWFSGVCVGLKVWRERGWAATQGELTSFKQRWSAPKLPGSSSSVTHTSVLFSLMSCMYGDTSARRVYLHGAALGLFMELSCAPGAGNSCGAPTHPSGPTGALELGKCHRSVNALFPLLRRVQGRGSGGGHVERF